MPSTRKAAASDDVVATEESGTRTAEKRILVAKEVCLQSATADIVALRHPRTSSAASFLIGSSNSGLHEVRTYAEDAGHRAWFIGEHIESKGCVYLATPADPLLVLLPYLRKAAQSGRKVPMDHCVVDSDYPDVVRLLDEEVTSRKRLERIADAKGSADLNVWQYNESKTLSYLSAKVHRLTAALKADRIDIEGGATSGAFVKSKNITQDDGQYKKFAFGILADSLEQDLADKLVAELKLPKEEEKSKKREVKTEEEEEESAPKAKKPRKAEPLEDYSKGYKKAGSKEAATPNAKQKALAQAATGSKNIMAFFKKK